MASRGWSRSRCRLRPDTWSTGMPYSALWEGVVLPARSLTTRAATKWLLRPYRPGMLPGHDVVRILEEAAAAIYALRRRAGAAPPPRDGEPRRLRAGCGGLWGKVLLARPLLLAAVMGECSYRP